MSRWIMLFLFSVISVNLLFAQQNRFEVKGEGTNIYLDHTVSPKESLFSVGRMYNVSPKELAAFNHIKMQDGLKIGEVLKIPLNKINFTQTGERAKTEVNVPVYHTVERGETLYRLGINYNKVPLTSIKRWNHLQSDELIVGAPVIIGFLKVDKAQSSLANRKFEFDSRIAETQKNEVLPAENKQEESVAVTPEIKKPEPAKPENNAPVQPKENTVTIAPVNTTNNSSGGYFINLYNQQIQNKSAIDKSGLAGVFKSTSGWQDGKYYCFNNDAGAGTVLKITDNTTGKIVYAKVLDVIPDIKQNEGLSIVISSAAAEAIGAGENKFDCVVSYAK
jgi:LysM repeat protein